MMLTAALGCDLRFVRFKAFYLHLRTAFHISFSSSSFSVRMKLGAASHLICALNLTDKRNPKNVSSCNLIHMGRNAIRKSGANPSTAWSKAEELSVLVPSEQMFLRQNGRKNGLEVVCKSTHLLTSEASFSKRQTCSGRSAAASDSRCGLIGERLQISVCSPA